MLASTASGCNRNAFKQCTDKAHGPNWGPWALQCAVCKHFGCIRKQCWHRFSSRRSHDVGFGKFQDHLNMLIKMTKAANPAGDLNLLRDRLDKICREHMMAIRRSITPQTWGSQAMVDWQMTFLNRCQNCINTTFLVNSSRWQIGYVEIC